ncbi:hypothetical protein D3C86_1912040 [compost metagenome]
MVHTLPLCLGVRPGRSPCTCAPPPLAGRTTLLLSILAEGIQVWLANSSHLGVRRPARLNSMPVAWRLPDSSSCWAAVSGSVLRSLYFSL